jgi:hypothetical protein
VDPLCNAGFGRVLPDDWLDTPLRVRSSMPGLELVVIVRVGGKVAIQQEPDGDQEQNAAVFIALPALDENPAGAQAHVLNLDAD